MGTLENTEDDLCLNAPVSWDFLGVPSDELELYSRKSLSRIQRNIKACLGEEWLSDFPSFHFLKLTMEQGEELNNQLQVFEGLSHGLPTKDLPRSLLSLKIFDVNVRESATGFKGLARLIQVAVLSVCFSIDGAKEFMVNHRVGQKWDLPFPKSWLVGVLRFLENQKDINKEDRKEIWQKIGESLRSDDSISSVLKSVEVRLQDANKKISKSAAPRVVELQNFFKLLKILYENYLSAAEVDKKATKGRRSKSEDEYFQGLYRDAEDNFEKSRDDRVRQEFGLRRRKDDDPANAAKIEAKKREIPILNRTGSPINLGEAWSNCNFDALTLPMMKVCVSHSVGLLDHEKDGVAAAAGIVVLTAISGWQYHELIASLTDDPDVVSGKSQKLRFDFDGKQSVLWISPPDLSEHSDHDVDNTDEPRQAELVGEIPISIPGKVASVLKKWKGAYEASSKKQKSELLRDICIGLKFVFLSIRRDKTQPIEIFTESRLRAGYFQSLVHRTDDIPKAQLVTGDRFEIGLSSLNYIVWDGKLLASDISALSLELLGVKLGRVAQAELPQLGHVGTAKAKVAMSLFETFQERYERALPKKVGRQGIKKTLSLYNRVAFEALVRFLIVTTHRNNYHLRELSGTQIDLKTGVVIFGDKYTDPGHFRRIVAIPFTVRVFLSEMMKKLRVLAEHEDVQAALDKESKKLVERCLDGKGPLFLHFEFYGASARAMPLSGIEVWREIFGEDQPANIHRHFFSTWMRANTNLSPGLIEAQMGHATAPDFFSEFGIGAPAEFVNEISPYLELLLEHLGLRWSETRARKRTEFELVKWFSDFALEEKRYDATRLDDRYERLHKAVKKEDIQLFDSQIEKQSGVTEAQPETELLQQSKTSVRNAIEEKLDDEGVPYNEIDLESVNSAIQLIKKGGGGDTKKINRILNRLQAWINGKRVDENWRGRGPDPRKWKVATPPLFTIAATGASDYLHTFRLALLTQGGVGDVVARAALFQIVFGDVRDFRELSDVFEKLTRIVWSKGSDPLLIDIPLLCDQSMSDQSDLADSKETSAFKAHCITGPALHSLVPVLKGQQKSPDNSKSPSDLLLTIEDIEKRIWDVLPEAFQPVTKSGLPKTHGLIRNLFGLVKLEQQISLPDSLRKAVSGQMVTRQLNSDGLLALILNDVARVDEFAVKPHRSASSKLKVEMPAAVEIDDLITKLGEIIPKRDEVGNSSDEERKARAKVIESVLGLNDTAIVSEVGDELIEFFAALLDPKANRHKGKPRKYAYSTLQNFLDQVSPAARLLNELGLQGYCPEEFETMFRVAVEDEPQSVRMTDLGLRFIYWLQRKHDIETPAIHDLAKIEFAEGDIDARCISDTEGQWMMRSIAGQLFTDSPAALAGSGLSHRLRGLAFQICSAVRTGEGSTLRLMDTVEVDGQETVLIRGKRDRALKTDHSMRLITAHTADGMTVGDLEAARKNRRTKYERVFEPPSGSRNKADFDLDQRKANQEFNRIVKAELVKVSGDPLMRRHSLRHGVATKKSIAGFEKSNLVKRYKYFAALQNQMGHASLETTFRHYSHALQLSASRIRRNSWPRISAVQCSAISGMQFHRPEESWTKLDQILLRSLKKDGVIQYERNQSAKLGNQSNAPKLSSVQVCRLVAKSVLVGYPSAAAEYGIDLRQSLGVLQGCLEIEKGQSQLSPIVSERAKELIALEKSKNIFWPRKKQDLGANLWADKEFVSAFIGMADRDLEGLIETVRDLRRSGLGFGRDSDAASYFLHANRPERSQVQAILKNADIVFSFTENSLRPNIAEVSLPSLKDVRKHGATLRVMLGAMTLAANW